MEKHNLGITMLECNTSAAKAFLKITGKPSNDQFHLPNILQICHNISHNLLRANLFLKNIWKFMNDPLFRYKSDPFSLFNVAAYWKGSNTETCAKTLSQIITSNSDNG